MAMTTPNTDLATIVAAMSPAPWTADIRTGQALVWGADDINQTCGANALARLDRGAMWDEARNGGAGGWTLPDQTAADAIGIAALRNAAEDLAAGIDAAYRRGWEDGKNAALQAANARVIADSDQIERELVRASRLATAPVSDDLGDVDDIPQFLRRRQAGARSVQR